jgi:hypothetical protein
VAANTADQARQQGMESWQNQIIKSGSTVSGTTTSGVNTATTNPVAVELYNMTDPQRLQIAQTLKNAGYKVPVTGKFNDTLVAQWSNVTMAAKMQAQSIGQPFDNNYLTGYLQQQEIANAAMDTAGAAKDFERKTIYDPTQAATVINTVYSDLLGRQASQKELDKYTKALQKAQASNPLKYTNTAGAGYTQQGGLDPQQFLIQQISGTDEAKANQVMGYYDTFKNLIGVR